MSSSCSSNSTIQESLEYPTTAELHGWVWQKGIFQSSALIGFFGVPIILLVISTLCFLWNARSRKKAPGKSEMGKNSKNNHNRSKEEGTRDALEIFHFRSTAASIASPYRQKYEQQLSRWKWIWSEGFRCETSPLNVKDLLREEIGRFKNTSDSESQEFGRRSGKGFKIHPKSNITEDDIRAAYPDFVLSSESEGGNNQEGGDDRIKQHHRAFYSNHVVLFFRFASIFVSTGMSTIENQDLLIEVGKALKLPPLSLLTLGLSEITVQFSLGAVINVTCSTETFYQLSLLSRAQQLARYVIENSEKERNKPIKENTTDGSNCDDIPIWVYLRVLDKMEKDKAADPYGWVLRLVAVYVVCVFAPLAVYGGGYPNLVWASIISIAIVAELAVLHSIWLRDVGGRWETPIVSFTTGLLSSVLWQATARGENGWFDYEVDQCAAHYTIGVLLIWFPGSSLVYGAHEVCLGSYSNGGTRLIKGIVSAMVMALFYIVGWQYWGRNWASDELMNGCPTNLYNQTGPVASLPPSVGCDHPSDLFLPWYINKVAFAIPLNAATMVIFNIRPRDCPGVFLVAQLTYLVQGLLEGDPAINEGVGLTFSKVPYYVSIMIIAFFGGCFSEINQQITGFSKYGSMLAIIFVLAPGAGAVRAILGSFHRYEGDAQANENTLWESVIFEGTAYAVGFYFAFDVLAPILKVIRRCIPDASKETNDSSKSSADNEMNRRS